jgi:hypothetical protein
MCALHTCFDYLVSFPFALLETLGLILSTETGYYDLGF